MNDQAKVAFVTGASRGLGRAIALSLAEAGYRLSLAARDKDALEQVAVEVRDVGSPEALVLAGDLRDAALPENMVSQTIAHFGRMDALVNNAGSTVRGDFLELSDALHLDGFALKYHAMVRFCRAAWKPLGLRAGSIVNISGVSGQTPEPGFTVGGPVNAAINNFSKALSKRIDGPRVNVVCPGHIETDRLARRIDTYASENSVSREVAAQRMKMELNIQSFGQPHDIASMVRYLCSPDAAYVNGACFVVDGGATPGI